MIKFYFGEKVKEDVTGFTGVVTAYAVYSTGEINYLIEGMDTTGRPAEFWYNENRLRSVE